MSNPKQAFKSEVDDYKVKEWEIRWINLLCSYGNRYDFEQVKNRSKNTMFAIMDYRRYLRGKGIGNVPFITINMAYTKRNYTKLHKLLQELFLEYISDQQFEYILQKIKETPNGIEKLYEKHNLNRNIRILNIMLTF